MEERGLGMALRDGWPCGGRAARRGLAMAERRDTPLWPCDGRAAKRGWGDGGARLARGLAMEERGLGVALRDGWPRDGQAARRGWPCDGGAAMAGAIVVIT